VLADALTELRDALGELSFRLATATSAEANGSCATMVAQLDDYLIPRLSTLDAPLLVVVGGSTGAGKSTLVNSIVQAPVSPTGVLRPTTREPVLVANPADARWFTERRLLPGLRRTTGLAAEPGDLRVITAPGLPPGLAVLDAPDIDSVVEANREVADHLLGAADLWLFVTTAARYADAVPWRVLQVARSRGTALALVLNRVPPGAEDEVSSHFGEMLGIQELSGAPLFVLPEMPLSGNGLLTDRLIAPMRDWLSQLAGDAGARADVVRQTVTGAVAALGPAVASLASAAEDQLAAARTMREDVHAAYRDALATVEDATGDGSLLRGEVLARWQEFVGTGELMRALQDQLGRLRDKVQAAVTGRPGTGGDLRSALSSGLTSLIHGALADAGDRSVAAWRGQPAGRELLPSVKPAGDGKAPAEELVRDWQRGVLALVRAEGANKRRAARVAAYTVNATGLLVMIAVFASTAFIPTGAEIAVGAGTTAAGQALLSAVFGDQAMRELAERSREDLITRVGALLDSDAARFSSVLDRATLPGATPGRLRELVAAVTARSGL
jgi:hypothetical protein